MCQTACVLPVSWTKFHIPQLISSSVQIAEAQGKKDIYGQCLLSLLNSFIDSISYLDKQENFQYTFGTMKKPPGVEGPNSRIPAPAFRQGIQGTMKKAPGVEGPNSRIPAPTSRQGIQERNRNFLVIALINLAAMHDQIPGSFMVSESAWKASRRSLMKYAHN